MFTITDDAGNQLNFDYVPANGPPVPPTPTGSATGVSGATAPPPVPSGVTIITADQNGNPCGPSIPFASGTHRFAPLSDACDCVPFQMDNAPGGLYVATQGPDGGQQNIPGDLGISLTPNGPIFIIAQKQASGAILHWCPVGSPFQGLGYPALQPGTTYYLSWTSDSASTSFIDVSHP